MQPQQLPPKTLQNASDDPKTSPQEKMFCCLSLLSSAPGALVATGHVLTMKGRTWGGRTAGEWASLSTHLKHNGSLRTKTRLVMQSNTLATTMTELKNVCSVSAAESVTMSTTKHYGASLYYLNFLLGYPLHSLTAVFVSLPRKHPNLSLRGHPFGRKQLNILNYVT